MDTLYSLKDISWEKGYKGYPTAYLKLKTPSISTIISDMIDDPEFEEWKRAVGEDAEKILQYCAYRGTALHLFCESFFPKFTETKSKEIALVHALAEAPILLSKEGVPDNSIIKGRDLFYKLYDSDIANKLNDVRGTELKINSPKLYVRGALDVLYVYNGKLYISDFKNSSKPLEAGTIKEYKYKIQLGGYAQMMEDLSNGKVIVDGCSIICTNTSNSDVQEILIEGDELSHYKEEFSKLAKGWHQKHNQGFLLNLV